MLLASLRISLRRTVTNLRLTLAVTFGIVLAVAIMSTTVVYFEALRDIALARSLADKEPATLDLQVIANQGAVVDELSDDAFREQVDDELVSRISKFTNEVYIAIQTRTFLVDEDPILVPIGQCACRPGGTATGPDDVPGRNSDGEIDPRSSDSLLACDCRRANFSTIPDLEDSVRFIEGRMPDTTETPGPLDQPLRVEAALDQASAQALSLSVGDMLPVGPFWESSRERVEVTVSGIYERVDPEDPHWSIQDGQFTDSTPNLLFARFIVPEETLLQAIGPYFPNMGAEYVWLLDVDPGEIHAADTGGIRSAITEGGQSLQTQIDGFRIRSDLQQSLADFEVSLFFNRIPMLIVFALVVAVALYYAAMVASTLISSQSSEIALMRSRGAARPQIFLVYLTEALILCLFAFITGPMISLGLVSLIGRIPIYEELNGGAALPVQLTQNVVLISGFGALLGLLALLIPAYRSTGLNVLIERRRRGRPGRLNVIQKYYLDLGLLGVVAATFWQLTKQGSFVATDLFGETSVNNLALAAPALLLVMSGFALLRLFPVLTEGVSRLFATRVGSVIIPSSLFLGIRQLARNPGGHARLSLLLVISAALGVFAATFASTLERSALDQVLYDTAAEFRATGVTHISGRRSVSAARELRELEGIGAVASMMRTEGITDSITAVGATDRFEVLGVDTDNLGEVSWYREDFLGGSMDDFLESVRPEEPPGIALPPDTRFVSVRVKSLVRRPEVIVVARFSDFNGRFYSVPFGDLTPTSTDANRFSCLFPNPNVEPDWCRLGSSIFPPPTPGASTLAPLQPVTLHSIGIVSTDGDLGAGSILIDDIQVLNNIGENPQIVESFDDLESWRALEPSADALGDTFTFGENADGSEQAGIARYQWTDANMGEYRGVAFGRTEPVVHAIVSSGFADARGASVGDVLIVSIENVRTRISVERIVDYFPTLDDERAPFAIFDLATLKARLNLGNVSSDIQPDEFWIKSSDDPESPELTAEQIEEQLGGPTSGNSFTLRSGPVLEQSDQLAQVELDPLVTTGWQALLGIAFVSVLTVSAAGYLIHARTTFTERKSEFALFRTIGISRPQLLMLITIEQVIVIGVAFAIGVFLGTRLGDTIFPFLAASGEAGSLAPPMIVQIEGAGVAAVFGTLGVVFAAAIGVVLWSASRMAIHSVMRAGDG